MRSVNFYQLYIKRVFDVIFSITLLTILFVPLLFVALWVKLDSKGPVFFKHIRAGKDRKPFMVYKFRSMSVSAPKYQATNDLLDAGAYITFSGRIMRKLSIDELPQLINVIKGEMSIVGPRPVILEEEDLLAEREKYNANSCKPGITGWAQVNGRDELRIKEKAKMDGYYVENFGLIMDIKCLVRTLRAVLSMHGHKEGHESKPIIDFDDSALSQIIEYARFNNERI